MLYTYVTLDPTAPWKSYVGNYTRYGDATGLVRNLDDICVVMHHGDEITLDFDARGLVVHTKNSVVVEIVAHAGLCSYRCQPCVTC